MEANKIVERLLAAYRKADRDFEAANEGNPYMQAFEFCRIIGSLKGELQVAALSLGYDGPMAENKEAA